MEKYFDMAFMLIGLGFFIFVMWTVENAEERNYNRKLSEAREFGFKGSKLEKKEDQPEPSTEDK